ncbi:hypothetical protein BH20CHL7_BH20CHL7_16590 [soil metagenome]
MIRDEVVRRRGWLDDAAYLDLVGVSNLIPGPTSSEVAMHVGHRRAGWAGFVVAGMAFVMPAVVIVGLLAWVYVTHGSQPAIGALLAGVAPVVIAIIAHAGWSIARTAIRTPLAALITVAAVAGSLAGWSEIALLLGLGAAALVVHVARRGVGRARGLAGVATLVPLPGLHFPDVATATATAAWAIGVAGATPAALFGEFLRIGSILFGSGYVLVAVLRGELVDGLGWITERQLIDAVAVGQATPGPLFSTATFIGYVASGPLGAVAATAGIFLPAFVAVALSIPLLGRLRRSASFRAFLDGVNAAVVGLLGVVALRLAVVVVPDPVAAASVAVAGVLLLRGVGTGWLVGAGALVGVARLALESGLVARLISDLGG